MTKLHAQASAVGTMRPRHFSRGALKLLVILPFLVTGTGVSVLVLRAARQTPATREEKVEPGTETSGEKEGRSAGLRRRAEERADDSWLFAAIADLRDGDAAKRDAAARLLLDRAVENPLICENIRALFENTLRPGRIPISAALVRLLARQGDTGATLISEMMNQEGGMFGPIRDLFPFDVLASCYQDLPVSHPVMWRLNELVRNRVSWPRGTPILVGSAILKCGDRQARSDFETEILGAHDVTSNYYGTALLTSGSGFASRISELTDYEAERFLACFGGFGFARAHLLRQGAPDPLKDLEATLESNREGVVGVMRRFLQSPEARQRSLAIFACKECQWLRDLVRATPELSELFPADAAKGGKSSVR